MTKTKTKEEYKFERGEMVSFLDGQEWDIPLYTKGEDSNWKPSLLEQGDKSFSEYNEKRMLPNMEYYKSKLIEIQERFVENGKVYYTVYVRVYCDESLFTVDPWHGLMDPRICRIVCVEEKYLEKNSRA